MAVEYCVVAGRMVSRGADVVVDSGGSDQRSCRVFWPRPGRIFAAARSHKFGELADAIDTAFARWDRSHLYKFELADGRLIGQAEFDDFDVGFIDGVPRPNCRRCPWVSSSSMSSTSAIVGPICARCRFSRIDPESELGLVPRSPLPYWGWGAIPTQYGRRWDSDDGDSPSRRIRVWPICRPCSRGGGRGRRIRPPIRRRRRCGVRRPPVTGPQRWNGVAAGCTTLDPTRRWLGTVDVWSPTVRCRAVHAASSRLCLARREAAARQIRDPAATFSIARRAITYPGMRE